MIFQETYIEGVSPFGMTECPHSLVCTVPEIKGGSLCFMDDGTVKPLLYITNV